MNSELDSSSLDSLSGELEKLTQLIKTRMSDKMENERKEILSEIQSYCDSLNEEFNEDDYKEMNTVSLNYVLKGLKQASKLLKKTTSINNEARLINRNGNKVSLSNEEIEDVLTDMVCLALNLPVPDKSIKEQIRLERMARGYQLR